MTSASHSDGGRRAERWPLRRGAAASLVLHLVVLGLILGLWRWSRPPDPPLSVIALVFEGTGASGTAGGGDSGRPGAAAGQEPAGQAAPSEAAADADAAAAPPAPEAAAPPATADPEPAQPEQPTSAPQAAQSTMPEAAIPDAPAAPAAPRPLHKPAMRVATAVPRPPPPPAKPELQTQMRDTASASPGAPAPAKPGTSGSGGGAGGAAGPGRDDAGRGRAALGDGDPNSLGDEYLERLRRWVNRYKQYPPSALDRKQEGQVLLGFTLERDGTVLDAWIEKSSGSKVLDEAALRMMHEASPVPPVPPSYRGSKLSLAMPVNYSIGFLDRLFR